MSTINTYSTWNGTNVFGSWGGGATEFYGQTFTSPNGDALDTARFYIQALSAGTFDFNYTAYIYEFNASTSTPVGSAITSKPGSFTANNTSFTPVDIDFNDVALDPSKTYLVTLFGPSANGARAGWGWNTSNVYAAGKLVFLNNNNPANTWATRDNDLAFIFNFSPATARFLQIPLGYFSETSNSGYGINGNITATAGNVSLSNGSDLQTGNYGTFYIQNGSNYFSYTPDQTKITPLKAGETVTDTFNLLLTASNGTTATGTYTVTIEGDGSDPTPTKSILITGDRGKVNGKPGIIIDGVTTGLDDGTKVIPWVRFPGQTGYTEASARPVVTDGEFSWSRKTRKKTYVYFTTEDQSVTSNKDVIPARLMLGSTFENDPITNAARYENDSAAVSDSAISNVISIGGTGKKNGSNRSKTADNLMAAGRRGLAADSNATVFSASNNALGYSSDSTADNASPDLIPVTSISFGKVETLV